MRSNGAGIEQIAVRAGDHGVGMLADAHSGAFQALVEQGNQLDRPVITEAFRDRAPDDSWRADLPPAMIIGAHRLDDEMLRLHEYSPGGGTSAFAFDPERFAAHEKFFVEDVRRWAQSRFGLVLPADRTAVFGVSAGGEFALAMGLRHPDI